MKEDFVETMRNTRSSRYRRTAQGETKLKQMQNNVEEFPKQESLKKRWGYGREDYTTKPLQKFLLSKEGKLWDDVYKEICEVNDRRNFCANRLIEAIDFYVTRDTQMIDGEVYDGRGMKVQETSSYRPDFYVHPETGILTKAKYVSRRIVHKSRNFPRIDVDEFRQYHRVKGLWYLVTFVPMENEKQPDVLAMDDEDRIHRQYNPHLLPHQQPQTKSTPYYTRAEATARYGAELRAVAKKQAGKRELKYIREHLQANGIQE